jgi:hypothetical protein
MTLFQRFKRLTLWNKLGVIASIVGILAFILTVITLPIFEQSKPPIPIYEYPMVSLDLGPCLDTKDPFGQTFVICNQGKQPVSNIWSHAYWYDPSTAKKMVLDFCIINPSIRLTHGMKQALHFTEMDFSSPKNHFPPFGARTFVNIDIKYTPDSSPHETNQIFKFIIYQDSAGNYVWLPTGEGESVKDIFDRMDQQTARMIDVVPYLDVRVTAVENVSETNKEHSLQIVYSWKNIGGRPATGIVIEWSVFDDQNWIFHCWSNRWSYAVLNQILWPGMTNGEARFYRDNTSPAFYEGIMSNKLKLFGAAQFKDLQNHDFDMLFKAIRTNDEFEVRCLALGGYFQEIKNTNSPAK